MSFRIVIAIVFIIFLLVIVDWIAPYRYDEINLDERFLPPSLKHLFGTDSLGRDLFTRFLYGYRLSLLLSILSIVLSTAIGFLMGVFSAFSKQLQIALDSIFNFLYIVPSIFIAVVAAFTTGFGAHIVVIAVILRLIPTFYRITKTVALTIAVQPYIEAAKAMGASTLYILTRYIAREALYTISILSIYSLPEALSTEITLSFIGLGIQPPTPSIGNILAEGIKYITIAPHIIIPPTIATFTTILAIDIIREKIEKHTKETYNLQL